MTLHYDAASDSLYLRLADAAVVDSEEVRPGIVLDFDAKDRVVSLEIRDIRKHLPDADIKKLQLQVA